MKWNYLIILSVFLFASCASRKEMPLKKKTLNVNTSVESIGLLSLRTENHYVTTTSVDVFRVYIKSTDGKKDYCFDVHEPNHRVFEEYNDYLLSFCLPPGSYTIESIDGIGGSCRYFGHKSKTTRTGPMFGQFDFYIKSKFEVAASTITYLGHIDMVNRKKIKGVLAFKEEYKVIKDENIIKNILIKN